MSATNFGQSWPSGWTTDANINAASIAANATLTSAAILNSVASPNEILDTECDLEIAYGITAVGVTVYILRQTQGGYQTTADMAYSFQMTGTPSTTVKMGFTVPGSEMGGFKVLLSNPSGNSSVTATLYYRQSQGQAG